MYNNDYERQYDSRTVEFKKGSQRGTVIRGVAIFVLITVIFAWLGYLMGESGVGTFNMEEVLAEQELVSMMNDMISNEPIKAERISKWLYGDSSEVIEISQANFIELQKVLLNFEEQSGAFDLYEAIDLEHFDDQEKIAEIRRDLKIFVEASETFANDVSKIMERYEAELVSAGAENEYAEEFVGETLELLQMLPETLRDTQIMYKELVMSLDDLLGFSESEIGTITTTSDYIDFDNDETRKKYEELAIILGENYEKFVEFEKIKNDELNKMISEF